MIWISVKKSLKILRSFLFMNQVSLYGQEKTQLTRNKLPVPFQVAKYIQKSSSVFHHQVNLDL